MMAKKHPAVSVVLPTYNAEAHIAETISSVIEQVYSDWELWVIDDGSTDNTIKIIQTFCARDARINFIHLSSNTGGPSEPRNIGIKNSKGRYIAFLDSDDIWLPEKLKEQINFFCKSDAGIVYSDYEKIDSKGTRSGRIIRNPNSRTYHDLLNGNVILLSSSIIDTSKCGKPLFPKIPHEDYVFWLSILKRGIISRNTGTLNTLYRVHSDSVSGNKFKALQWTWNIFRNEEQLPLWDACYHFFCYMIYAGIKYLH